VTGFRRFPNNNSLFLSLSFQKACIGFQNRMMPDCSPPVWTDMSTIPEGKEENR
jgi:hypothetical protein